MKDERERLGVLPREERREDRSSWQNAERAGLCELVQRAEPDNGEDGELVEEFNLVADDLDDLRCLVERALEVLRHHPVLMVGVQKELEEGCLCRQRVGKAISCM
jgi:chloramphenicol 3-O-phosphotransferase